MKKICSVLLVVLLSALPVFAASNHTVALSWIAPSGATPLGYNVYRLAGTCPANPSLSQFTKINTSLITTLTYTDSGLADGVTNCYAPTAVYSGTPSNVESGAGFYAQVTTPTIVAVQPATPPSAAPTPVVAN